jgi:hypothetical protein
MRSRGDRVRRVVEHALRGVALAALAALFWRAVRPPAPSGLAVAHGDVASSLARWTAFPPGAVHVVLDAAPGQRTRDWLRALAHAGTPLRWSAARPIVPASIVAEPLAEPHRGTRVRFAASGSDPVSVGDDAGMIDTLPSGGAAQLELAAVAGEVRATGRTFAAGASARDSVELRPVLVLSAASWESKFVIAALEERGWRVAARARVAPAVEVTQGPLGAIDTAHYAAVIALDSTAAPYAGAIARYARDGGGVILAGAAARIAGLAGVAPGAVGRRMAGVAGAVASDEPRSGLPAYHIASLRPDAIALESRDATPVIAARRASAGRVLQSGYDETWRWRMSGGDGAVAAHREWWSRLVSAVAYAPLVPVSHAAAVSMVGASPDMLQPSGAPLDEAPLDEAPLAALIDALGAPAPLTPGLTPEPDPARATRILFALVVGSLLLEWTSRRLRGSR